MIKKDAFYHDKQKLDVFIMINTKQMFVLMINKKIDVIFIMTNTKQLCLITIDKTRFFFYHDKQNIDVFVSW